MSLINQARPPLPPFTLESAVRKVRIAEDVWNSRNPDEVVQAYIVDTQWRNRSEFLSDRDEVRAFLCRKWTQELDFGRLAVDRIIIQD